jgi:hypothetical protein
VVGVGFTGEMANSEKSQGQDCDHALLYHTVLSHWRRTHAELRAMTEELRLADECAADASAGSAAVRLHSTARCFARLLYLRRAQALERALRSWILAVAQIHQFEASQRGAALLRQERAVIKELESQLAAMQEAAVAWQQQRMEDGHDPEGARRRWAPVAEPDAKASACGTDGGVRRHLGAQAQLLLSAWERGQTQTMSP